MSENLTSQFGLGWGNGCCDENNCGGFGGGCNGSFFETLIMLIIIIWLLRWLFSCGTLVAATAVVAVLQYQTANG